MHPRLNQAILGASLLALLACSGGGDSKAPTIVTGTGQMPSSVQAVFDPLNKKIPLPNVLATAMVANPTLAYGTPMTPDQALAYVAYNEVGGPNYGYPDNTSSTHAVSGLNAPIYFAFSNAVKVDTVNASTVKVFQILVDSNNTALTENAVLGFRDVSALFTYTATPSPTSPNPNPNAGAQNGSTKEWLIFPKVPLTPGARYVYVVTDGVKDPADLPVTASPYFEALKSVTPLTTSFLTLEAVRKDNLLNNANPQNNTTNPILLSGYYKVMNDLITNAAADTTSKTGATATGIASRANITLMGRFITTGAGGIRLLNTDGSTTSPTGLKPLDVIFRGFAAGSFGAAKTWNNSITIEAAMPAATYYSMLPAPLSSAPHSNLATVVIGTFHSADLAIDPTLAKPANLAGVDLTTLTGGAGTAQGATNPYCFTTGITQAARNSGQLVGFYNTDRQVRFVYFIPAGGAASYPTVILQHGITSQKEAAAAAADTIALSGKATIAIDLPMHGDLASPAHTVVPADYTTFPDPTKPTKSLASMKQEAWGSDFMSLTSLLTGRTNIQQSALNLHRLEILMRGNGSLTPFQAAFAAWTTAPYTTGITGGPKTSTSPNQDITFVGQSLGSIVGAYYLAGNTTFTGGAYSAASLGQDMKGFLSVPGSTIGYLLKDSQEFGPVVNGGLSLGSGGLVVPGTTLYTQFFLLAQTLVDPVDPASMTLPLAATLPSRLSMRLAVQEAVGDTVIPNYTTRYFGQTLGVFTPKTDVASSFLQLAYSATAGHAAGIPAAFMANPTGAATSPFATAPYQGYFQWDQTGINHGFLLNGNASTPAAQKQMLFFLGGPDLGAGPGAGASIVVDPYSF